MDSRMDRRTFLGALCCGMLAVPRAVDGQETRKVYRIGVLSDEPSSSNRMYFREPLRKALHDLGYVEGRSIIIEYRSTAVGTDQLPRLASEPIQLRIDVLVTIGTPAARAAQGSLELTSDRLRSDRRPGRYGSGRKPGSPGRERDRRQRRHDAIGSEEARASQEGRPAPRARRGSLEPGLPVHDA